MIKISYTNRRLERAEATSKPGKDMGGCVPRASSSLMATKRKENILIRVPGATVYLVDDEGALELAKGDLDILSIIESDVVLATIIKIGSGFRWPLTKDEPVLKVDTLHYLFTLPDKEGFLNYGVTFAAPHSSLAYLDAFLANNACFTTSDDTKSSKNKSSYEVYWKDYAPSIDDYNGILAKAIAGGTGQIVKGLFKLSNGYASQVHKAAIQLQPIVLGDGTIVSDARNQRISETKKNQSEINTTIRRVRKLSETTEKMSRSLLDVVIQITGSVAAPFVQSKAGKSILSTVPGEVILASLDAVNKVMDAVEIVERRALATTSSAVSGAVSKTFGQSAGEATEDVFAAAGSAVGTAWNILKIRKAVNPSSSIKSSIVQHALRNK